MQIGNRFPESSGKNFSRFRSGEMELREVGGPVGDFHLLGDQVAVEVLHEFRIATWGRFHPHGVPAVAEANVVKPRLKLHLRAGIAEVRLAAAAKREILGVVGAQIAEKHRRVRPGEQKLRGGGRVEERGGCRRGGVVGSHRHLMGSY